MFIETVVDRSFSYQFRQKICGLSKLFSGFSSLTLKKKRNKILVFQISSCLNLCIGFYTTKVKILFTIAFVKLLIVLVKL